MDWIRLKLKEALGDKKPISKKLLIFLGLFVFGVVFLINSLAAPKVQQIEIANSNASTKANAASDSAISVERAKIFIHIVGEVNVPGIYELEAGSRLMDVVFAAGGLAESADQSSVNLARELTDGEQVIVFKSGSLNAPTSLANRAGSQISLNRSTQSDLEELPGVGPALAGRMVDWRSANGGFKKKEDLLNISGIGDKLFAAIKDQVVL